MSWSNRPIVHVVEATIEQRLTHSGEVNKIYRLWCSKAAIVPPVGSLPSNVDMERRVAE